MDSLSSELFTREKFAVFWGIVTKLTALFMVLVAPFQAYRESNSILWPLVCGSAASLVPDLGLPDNIAETLMFGLRVGAVITLLRYLVRRREAAKVEKGGVGAKAAGTGNSTASAS